jgi:hypothetical protein
MISPPGAFGPDLEPLDAPAELRLDVDVADPFRHIRVTPDPHIDGAAGRFAQRLDD